MLILLPLYTGRGNLVFTVLGRILGGADSQRLLWVGVLGSGFYLLVRNGGISFLVAASTVGRLVSVAAI